jgi:hypothetical protein
LAVHYRDGGGRWLARVVCEYATVAALVLLLVIAAGGTAPQPPAHHRPATANAGEQFCPKPVQAAARGACDFIAELWHHAQRRTGQQQAPPTTTRPRRR